MEIQKSSSEHPLLSCTSRQFYTRRVAPRPNSNAQIDKVLKLFNRSQEKKSFNRVKTQPKQQRNSLIDTEMENMKKLAKFKLQNLIKKEGKEWKQLLECFQNYSKSPSRQCLIMNEVKFMLKLQQSIKNASKQSHFPDRMKTKDEVQYRIKDHKIQLQNIKLQKQNEIMKQKVAALQNQSNLLYSAHYSNNLLISPPTLKFIEPADMINQALLPNEKLNQLHRQLETLRQTNDLLRDEKKNLQQKINELKNSNENLCQQIMKNRSYNSQSQLRYEKWRNIMSMQHQQIISLKRDGLEMRKSFDDLNRKYQNMLKRMSKMASKDQTKLSGITKKTVQIFSQQIESFLKVRNNFVVKGFYQTSSNTSKDPSSLPYKACLNEKQTIKNPEGIKKSSKQYLRYYKPSFYVFLQKYFEHQGVDRQNLSKIDLFIGVSFLITLRAILDSKYNEYLLCKKSKRYFSSLPAFTFSWLANFTIDPKSKKQQQISTDICFQTIGSFYVRLMSHSLNNNWQAITFRQLLLQTLTIDQLVFYLKARFFLIKGDGSKGRGAFTQIYYTNLMDALFLIQQVVVDFDYRKKIEQYVKRSVQFHRKRQLVDAHFVLRILLQYYQYKKALTFSIISKTFYTFSRQRNCSMPFQSFLKIFDYHFFQINLAERVQIYQKAFSLGRGAVHLQNIFTVINEEGFLLHQVQKMFSKRECSSSSTPDEQFRQIRLEQPVYIQNFNRMIQKQVAQEVSKSGIQWTKKLTAKPNPAQDVIQCILQRLQITFQLSTAQFTKLFHSKKLKQDEVVTFIQTCTTFLKQMLKYSIQKKNSIQFTEQFNKKNAAKKIIHFYRKKRLLSRNYMTFNEQDEKSNQKTEQIRKEFSNLIENLKKKYSQKDIKVKKVTSELEIEQ